MTTKHEGTPAPIGSRGVSQVGFTPGPLVARGVHVLRGNTIIAETFPTSLTGDDGEERANAVLFADAPDLYAENVRLLEALETLANARPDRLDCTQDALWEAMRDIARDALKGAE